MPSPYFKLRLGVKPGSYFMQSKFYCHMAVFTVQLLMQIICCEFVMSQKVFVSLVDFILNKKNSQSLKQKLLSKYKWLGKASQEAAAQQKD